MSILCPMLLCMYLQLLNRLWCRGVATSWSSSPSRSRSSFHHSPTSPIDIITIMSTTSSRKRVATTSSSGSGSVGSRAGKNSSHNNDSTDNNNKWRRHDAPNDDNLEDSVAAVTARRRSPRGTVTSSTSSTTSSNNNSDPRVRRHIKLTLEENETTQHVDEPTITTTNNSSTDSGGDSSSKTASKASTTVNTKTRTEKKSSQVTGPSSALLSIMPSLPPVLSGEPANWRAQLWAIQRMRMPIPEGREAEFANDPGNIGIAANAPVDTVGCQELGDRTADPKVCCSYHCCCHYNVMHINHH
jgi:hypothetical protein